MEIHRGEKENSQEAEIREALTDLAQFALQMNASASGSASQSLALLLQRLLLLCEAQHGALFLAREEQYTAGQQGLFAAPSRKIPQIIALHGLGEEEAYTLLSSFLPIALPTATVKTASDAPCWALCHLPTSAPSMDREAEVSQRGALPLLFGEAWLLFGWPDEADGACDSLLERARTLLPLVAVPAGAALLSLLQAEHIHELEAATYQGSVREMELLKAELLATVSHEFRSPLACVKGYTATLLRHERRISAEERHEFLLAIQQASDRLQFIVDRFLEMSQLETESIKVSPILIDVTHIVQEAIGAAEARVSRQEPGEFTFRMHVRNAAGHPTSRVPLINADPRLLREVLDHLLENAVSYSADGGLVEVILRPVPASSSIGERLDQISETEPGASRKEGVPQAVQVRAGGQRPQEMLEICVRDRGMGIASEHLERVFDRFYRVDTTLTRSVGGLGLGLSISKRIVELHHGTIWAEDRSDGGTAFSIRLPVTLDEARTALA